MTMESICDIKYSHRTKHTIRFRHQFYANRKITSTQKIESTQIDLLLFVLNEHTCSFHSHKVAIGEARDKMTAMKTKARAIFTSVSLCFWR